MSKENWWNWQLPAFQSTIAPNSTCSRRISCLKLTDTEEITTIRGREQNYLNVV